jgi:serine/threonine-protein kinase
MSALDQTLVDPNSLSPPRAGGPSLRATQVDAAPPGNANNRSTILPRIAYTGDIPQLVTDARDRFETAKVLGRGGAGGVVLARDNDLERPVAVKRLLPELDDPGLIGRFVDEIRVLGALDHPNIVPIHDVGVDPDGRYYYVMKYVEGETLEHIIEKLAAGDREYHARYPFERRVEVFRQVLRAVQYAHARGVIHRDIKPANVMVGRYGEVLVMDWGIARRLHADEKLPFPVRDSASTLKAPRAAGEPDSPRHRTVVGQLIGTPAYMSPEQARGDHERLDERSDVYALCVMFHELLTLTHYLGHTQTVTECLGAAQQLEVPFASDIRSPHQPMVPADLAHFIRHGVSKNAAERHRSITVMLDRLQAIEEGHCPVECPATFMKRMGTETTHAIDRRPFVLLGAVSFTLVMALLGVAMLVVSVTT